MVFLILVKASPVSRSAECWLEILVGYRRICKKEYGVTTWARLLEAVSPPEVKHLYKEWISNYRKNNDDSFEFYTPVEDTDLIITWRIYADIERDGDAAKVKYSISLDSIRSNTIEFAYDLFEVTDLLGDLVSNIPHGFNGSPNNSTPVNVILKQLAKTREECEKEKISYILDPKSKKHMYVTIGPRFSCFFIKDTNRSFDMLDIKSSCPSWITHKIKNLQNDLASFSSTDLESGITSNDIRKEIERLTEIKDASYQIYYSGLVNYSELIQRLPKGLQIYYSKSDTEVLQKSLRKTGLVQSKFTDLQKVIAFGVQNEVFFGRSGTGKTHCCVHAMVSRHLTVDAINKKLQQKKTEEVGHGLRSIFITASPLLAKEVKAQYETTLNRAERLNARQEVQVMTEDSVFENLHQVQMRSKELPRTFLDDDISYPLFLSHQEFVTILYSTMVDNSADFKHVSSAVKMEVNDDDKIIEKRISDIMKSFGQQDDKMKKALKLMPKRRGKAASESRPRKQIDFRTFYEDFYKKKIARNVKLAKISSNVAWSEIRTKIKGSSFKYFEECCGASFNVNDDKLRQAVKNNYLQLQTDAKVSALVWEIFESYEGWKQENNYYDIEDFVGLFYRKIKKWPFKDFNFDLIVIDEVQDLSFNSISVLTNLCLNNFMICGDNAQNIEKGINFKFKDLRTFLSKTISNRSTRIVDYGDFYNQEVNLPELSHYHLGLNFRSSREILDLANLVVCLLETYFGKEIDSFPKEKGFFRSPKPVVIELGQDITFLVDFLETYLKMEVSIETEDMDMSMDTSAALVSKRIKIGNDFCVIVRDEAAKLRVPEALKNCIILTLQESKGLEFENVLLYNHFTGNDAEKGWRYIYSRTGIEQRQLKGTEKSELENETDLFRRSKLELQKLVKEESGSLFEFSTNAALDQISVQAQLEGLSADMKFLYVAITRTKKNLIIYDHAVPKPPSHVRSEFDKMCAKLDLIEKVSSANQADFADKYQADPNWKSTQQAIARDKGFCFLKQGEYASAERFFKASNDSRLVLYCKASEKAKAAGDLLSLDFDDELKKSYPTISDLHSECHSSFREAAKMFASIGKKNEAGKCCFNGEDYEQASNYFRESDNKLHLAHSLFMMQKYEIALPIYYELEQDEMVQACLYNLSEGGKDMRRFASLLSSMSDDAKQLAKCDDSTFIGYVISVFEELQNEIQNEDDFFAESAIEDLRTVPNMDEPKDDEIEEKYPVEKMENREDDSFAVISDRKSEDDFMEIRSVISELKSAGGSFEKLPSLRSEKPGQSPTAIVDMMISKLETFLDRLKILLNKLPGHEVLLTNTKESNIQNMLLDLAVVYKFEDVGLEIIKASPQPELRIHQRLILNKLLNIDFNVSESTKLDPFTPTTKNMPAQKENMDDLVILNIFDAVSSFKFLPTGEFNKVDDIIKHLFFPICIMGLAEYFYPLAIEDNVKSQLSYFISKQQLAKLQKNDIDGLRHADENTSENKIVDSTQFIINRICQFYRSHENMRSHHKIDMLEVNDLGLNLVELFRRIIESRDQVEAREQMAAIITGCNVWEIIRLLRNAFKNQFLIQSVNRIEVTNCLQKLMGIKDCSSVSLLNGALDEFVTIDSNTWIIDLAKSNPELSSGIRTDKSFSMYRLTKDCNLCLVSRELYTNFVFNVCVFELLSLYKIRNQNDLIQLELLSGLSTLEKKAIKFNKLYITKADEILLTFKYEQFEPAILDDYFYRKVLGILGKEKMVNFFTVYQYYSLLQRNPLGNKLIPELISRECSKSDKKKNRTFFMLKEIDDLIKEGQISKAYYRVKDHHDYCEEKSISATKSNDIWMNMKEVLLLLLANGLVSPKDDINTGHYSFMDYILLPSYFKEQIKSANWVFEKDGQFYIDDNQIDINNTDEIAHNIRDKLFSILDDEPKSLYQVTPDLKDYIEGIFSEKYQRKHQFYLENPDFIKLFRLSTLDTVTAESIVSQNKERVTKEIEKEKEAIAKAEDVNNTLGTISKLKNFSSTVMHNNLVLADRYRGKIFSARQTRNPNEEICRSNALKNRIITFLLEVLLI